MSGCEAEVTAARSAKVPLPARSETEHTEATIRRWLRLAALVLGGQSTPEAR